MYNEASMDLGKREKIADHTSISGRQVVFYVKNSETIQAKKLKRSRKDLNRIQSVSRGKEVSGNLSND